MVEIFVNLRSFLLTTKSMANLSEMPPLALPPAKLRFEPGLDGHTRVFDTLRLGEAALRGLYDWLSWLSGRTDGQ